MRKIITIIFAICFITSLLTFGDYSNDIDSVVDAGISSRSATSDPIEIFGNLNFTFENGVTEGSGTLENPFIIKDQIFNVSNEDGISIENTDLYCKIFNCIFIGEENGIILVNVRNITIDECKFYNTVRGVWLKYSGDSSIINSVFINTTTGISGYYVDRTKIESNNFDSFRPMSFGFGSFLEIKFNIARSTSEPIHFSSCSDLNIKNNELENCSFFFSNARYENYDISGNTINQRPVYTYINSNGEQIKSDGGQYIFFDSENIVIDGALFHKIPVGIQCHYSANITIKNCIFNQSSFYCMDLRDTQNLSIVNNHFQQSKSAIKSWSNDGTIVKYNRIENCEIGMNIRFGNGEIYENTLQNNVEGMDIGLHSGLVYNNNFNNNDVEAENRYDDCKWNTSEMGNYWSEYDGLDDGSGGRPSGDGIGDTEIPYLGIDHFPLMEPVSIVFPEIPQIDDLDMIITPNVNITWNTPNPMDEYHLELASTDDFSDIVLKTSVQDSNIILNLPEGTYWIRVRSFVNELKSGWSEPKSFIVNFPPEAPNNFIIDDVTNDLISFSWEAQDDILDNSFVIEYSTNENGPFSKILITEDERMNYTLMELNENTTYFIRLSITDQYGLVSNLTPILNATTLFDPKAPILLSSQNEFSISEDTPVENFFNLNEIFEDINNDTLSFSYSGDTENVSISLHENGSVSFIPVENWNGIAYFTFIASDSVFNTSWNIRITVQGVNDPPFDPHIELLENEYIEGGPQWVGGTVSDHDMEYGELLTYSWSTLERGTIGSERNINLSLEAGTYTLIMNVSDKSGSWVETSINIEIESVGTPIQEPEKNDSTKDKELPIIPIVIGMVLVIAIVIIARIIIFLKKKKPETSQLDKPEVKLDEIHQPVSHEELYPDQTVEDIIPIESELNGYSDKTESIEPVPFPTTNESMDSNVDDLFPPEERRDIEE